MKIKLMTDSSVIAEGIVKCYEKTQALKGISFRVNRGEIFGIIGPDGAGKTSLFRILATLLLADQGQASIEGLDVVKNYKEIRSSIGYMPGRFSLYQDLSVQENLKFFATIFKTSIEENYHLIEPIYKQIEPFKHRKAGALSGGMKQKLALSCALIHKPKVLLLDEPTTGVDPVSRKEFWEMLQNLQKTGITILVSTPYMDEAMLCDRIALIKEGCFLGIDSPKGIIDSFQETLWAVQGEKMSSLLRDLRKYPKLVSAFAFGDEHHVVVDSLAEKEELRVFLENKGHTNIVIRDAKADIEDCYMRLAQLPND